MMASGEWRLTHQGLAIGEDGTLLDGQHRLLALIKSQTSLQMNVTVNVPKASYPYFDLGIKRGLEDALHESKSHVEVASMFFRLVCGDSGVKATPKETHDMISVLTD